MPDPTDTAAARFVAAFKAGAVTAAARSLAATLASMPIVVLRAIHYPACTARCDGDRHYVGDGDRLQAHNGAQDEN